MVRKRFRLLLLVLLAGAAVALVACDIEDGAGAGGAAPAAQGTASSAQGTPEPGVTAEALRNSTAAPRPTSDESGGSRTSEEDGGTGARPSAPRGETARVVRVVDGDTIEVDLGGRVETVRYIGVDTPETSHPSVGVECFGREARDRNRALVEGQAVVLERDVSETDRYGRLLRYVWLGDTLVNEALVRDGYAVVSTYPPDVKYQERFLAAERQARDAGRGLWGACGGADTPAGQQPPPPTTSAPPPAGPAPGNCHPSYPDVCIPPPPPDLDCSEIPHRNIRVLPPDPHRLDGNRDGVGCEG